MISVCERLAPRTVDGPSLRFWKSIGRWVPWLWLAAASVANASVLSASDSYSVEGIVRELHVGLSEVTFTLDHHAASFTLVNPQASIRVIDLLEAAKRSRSSVSVEFDPASGFVRDDQPMPIFLARSIFYQGERAEAAMGAATEPPSKDPATAAFIRGVAEFEGTRYSEAVESLSSALAGALPPRLTGSAYKVRGLALSGWVFDDSNGPTAEGDVRLAAALKDMVEWVRASPDDPQARYAIAGVLHSLGAYEEAIATYRDIATQWPKEQYWSAIRTGIIEREQGHYPEALKVLDDLVARAGAQSGMPFHYHRAWTLLELNRPADAVVEMDQGMQFQPNYAWAYVMRSCAYASQGQFARALEDQRKALSILRGLPPRGLVGDRFNLDRASAVERELADEVASGATEARKQSCGGYWREPEHPRARSPVLPNPALPPLPRHIEKPETVPLLWIVLLILLGVGAIALIVESRRRQAR